MRLDELKKGFWGYKRESVYRYITMLEEETSKKLEEQQEQVRREAEKAEKRIYELEEALKLLREENETLSRDQIHVSAALMDAQRFSREAKEEALRCQEETKRDLEKAARIHMDQLEAYSKKIKKLGSVLRELLQDMEVEAERMDEEVGNLKEQAPVPSFPVFPNRTRNGSQESA